MLAEVPGAADSSTSPYLESLILGVIQGLTEFLPVSSSGHLVAAERLFGSVGQQSLTTEIALHFATVLAVVLVFRAELAALVRGAVVGGEERIPLLRVVVACIPAAVVGILAHDALAELPRRWPLALPICWVTMAGVLFSLRGRGRQDEGSSVGWNAALVVGLVQALAILPGISRSGITIGAALWLGVRRDEAASFSFLVAIPIILGATVLETVKVWGDESAELFSLPMLLGGISAFVTGIVALMVLLGMLRRGALHLWGFYLLPVGIAYGWWLLG